MTLTAAARCLSRDCGWTAAGDPDATDKAAARHTERPPKHATVVVVEPVRRAA